MLSVEMKFVLYRNKKPNSELTFSKLNKQKMHNQVKAPSVVDVKKEHFKVGLTNLKLVVCDIH